MDNLDNYGRITDNVHALQMELGQNRYLGVRKAPLTIPHLKLTELRRCLQNNTA